MCKREVDLSCSHMITVALIKARQNMKIVFIQNQSNGKIDVAIAQK